MPLVLCTHTRVINTIRKGPDMITSDILDLCSVQLEPSHDINLLHLTFTEDLASGRILDLAGFNTPNLLAHFE